MTIPKTVLIPAVAAAALALACPDIAAAHPHVFAETHTEVIGDNGQLAALRHVWRFDEFFSATVLVEFDKDGNGKLDDAELKEVTDTIKQSTEEFNFFQSVTDNGHDVKMTVPGEMMVYFEGPQMILIFESVPDHPVALKGKLAFGIFDPTFYTSLDFADDKDLVAENFPASCKTEVVRPDPDEFLAQNQASLTDQFFAEAATNDISRMFATRLEATC